MRVKRADHPAAIARDSNGVPDFCGLGERLSAAGFSLSTTDNGSDESVEMFVTTLDGSEPSKAQEARACAIIRADRGDPAVNAGDASMCIYLRGGKVYAEDESGNSLLLGSIS